MLSERLPHPGPPCRRRAAFIPGAAVLALLLALSCGEDSGDEDRTPPPAPAMRLKNCAPDAALPETGVDADATSGYGVRLEWDMEAEPEDLAGFQVYRSWYPDSGYRSLELDPERFLEGRPDYYTHLDLDPSLRPTAHIGPRAWYYVTALDRDGNESAPSDTASYRLWASPRLLSEWVAVANDTLNVTWQFEFVDMVNLGFRGFRVLIAAPGGGLEWSRDILLDWEIQMNESWPLAELGLVAGDHRLRVDTLIEPVAQFDSVFVAVSSNPDGCPLSGSESYWISFTF